jgi:pimeloyl-ACP methyl ester carboxylesterase
MNLLDHPLICERYFFPEREPLADAVQVPVEGGVLACWRSRPPSDRPVLVHFHGNGERVHHWIGAFVSVADLQGFDVFLAEYRGYGGSTGTPALVGMLDDVGPIMSAVGVASDRVVAFGRSVGSIYAIELAHRFPDIAGLVLESGIADVAQRLLERVQPAELGCSQADFDAAIAERFDHRQKLAGFTGPLLVLHAEQDTLVTVDHGVRNHAWAGSSDKTLVRFPEGDHNTILSANAPDYIVQLRRFLLATHPG